MTQETKVFKVKLQSMGGLLTKVVSVEAMNEQHAMMRAVLAPQKQKGLVKHMVITCNQRPVRWQAVSAEISDETISGVAIG